MGSFINKQQVLFKKDSLGYSLGCNSFVSKKKEKNRQTSNLVTARNFIMDRNQATNQPTKVDLKKGQHGGKHCCVGPSLIPASGLLPVSDGFHPRTPFFLHSPKTCVPKLPIVSMYVCVHYLVPWVSWYCICFRHAGIVVNPAGSKVRFLPLVCTPVTSPSPNKSRLCKIAFYNIYM